MTRKVKLFISLIIGAALLTALPFGSQIAQAAPLAAADYPKKSIEWIVMWRAGGGADTATRMFIKYFQNIIGQQVIVKNITGGGGSIGYLAALQAKPDGYSLVTIQGDLPKFTPMKLAPIAIDDFDIIGGFAYQSPIIIARKDAPWNSIADFEADAKKNPGS